MSCTRNQWSLAFNEQHVSSFSYMARVQQPSSFATASWHLHSNTLFPLAPMHLLSMIPIFLMSSDPSLVLPPPFTSQTFPNSHAPHPPNVSYSLPPTGLLASFHFPYIYTHTHTQRNPRNVSHVLYLTLFSMTNDQETAGNVAHLKWDLCWLGQPSAVKCCISWLCLGGITS